MFVLGCSSATHKLVGETLAATDTGTVLQTVTDTSTGTDNGTCPEILDVGDPDNDTCADTATDTSTSTSVAGAPDGGVVAPASFMPSHPKQQHYDGCSPARQMCLNQCQRDMNMAHDQCARDIFGTDAGVVGALVTLSIGFKAQLLRACSALSWRQILTRAGIAAAIITAALVLLDLAIWGACSREIRRNYNACVASCPNP
jgi:hypothetical protein